MKKMLLPLFLLLPGFALAHTGQHDAGGFAAGFLHPLTGPDHLLAMLCVGLLSMQLRPGAVRVLHPAWLLPAAFLLAMGAGGAAGFAGAPLPWVEAMITASVFVGGIAVLSGSLLPAGVAMVAVALFALFHGYAHGAEIPADAAILPFTGGFLLATAVIHLLGVWLALASRRVQHGAWFLRLAGVGVIAAGAGLVIA